MGCSHGPMEESMPGIGQKGSNLGKGNIGIAKMGNLGLGFGKMGKGFGGLMRKM